MDSASVRLLLRDVLGTRVEVSECRLLKEMRDYWVWEMQTRNPCLRLIVKLAGPQASYTCAFERTAALHKLVGKQKVIPLPEVIAADEGYQKWPWRYFIKTYLPGIEWHKAARRVSPEALNPARFQLGEAVAGLHQIQFTGFGELDQRAAVPDPLPYPNALARRIRYMVASPAGQDFVFSMLEKKRGLFQDLPTPALCHEDLHHYNLLLEFINGEWRLAAILDFEKAWAGEPEIDLARMELWRMTGEAFWKAYLERRPVDEGYAERKAFYQLIWCAEYAENSTEHLETIRRLCRSLGLPVITSFEPFQVKI